MYVKKSDSIPQKDFVYRMLTIRPLDINHFGSWEQHRDPAGYLTLPYPSFTPYLPCPKPLGHTQFRMLRKFGEFLFLIPTLHYK